MGVDIERISPGDGKNFYTNKFIKKETISILLTLSCNEMKKKRRKKSCTASLPIGSVILFALICHTFGVFHSASNNSFD